MSLDIKYIKDTEGNNYFPVVHERGVVDDNGTTLESKLQSKQDAISDLTTIRSGAAAGATAVQPATTLAGYGITDGYTKTEGQALENTVDDRLDNQDAAIALLNGSEVIVVADHTQVASPNSQKIYREQGSTSYTDWMYQDSTWKEIASYNFPGIDDEPTAGSNNLVKSGGVFENLTELAGEVDGVYDFLSSAIRFDESSEFYICDKNGNVIFKVDSDGIHTTNVNVKSLIKNNDNELIVTDGQGNIIAKVDKDGFKAVKVVAREIVLEDGKPLGTQYADFDLYTVGDSFSAGNYWNVKCAEILGCNFDAEANIKPGLNISTGGSSTRGGGLSSAFFRVKNLYDQNIVKDNGENAIILLQNVNDINGGVTGTIDDVPLIPKTPIETNTQVEDFSSATLAAIPVNKRELSACLTLLVSSMGTRLTISSLPTREGNVTIMTGWGGVGRQYYNIHVVPQATTTETMAYCLARILEYNYTGVTVIDGGDGQSVIFSAGVSSPYYTFLEFYDTDNTGMTCTKSETDSVPAYIQSTRFYIGETLNDADWNNVSKWMPGSYLNAYRAWKSCIEYLMNKFPKAHVMITGFPNFKCVHGDYLRYDGMPDQDAFYNSEVMVKNRAFFSFLKEIAAYYNIPYIGVGEECGIDIMNISTFYPSNDIHPNKVGFERMARYVAREIQKYV